MIEIGVFHNGASDLPTITTREGVEVNDGTFAEVHASNQRVLLDHIRQGILADRLGFNYFFMTEHHFQPEGAEFSKGVAHSGRPADVAAEIMKVKEGCGYKDFIVNAWFETGGFEGREIEDQMQYFAEEVSPLIVRASGGQKQNPEVNMNLDPANAKQ